MSFIIEREAAKVASTSADTAPLASQIAGSDSDLTAVRRECKAMQARPTEAEQVAEQQKDAAELLTKHRTTPDSLRKSLYGKRSKQADKETAQAQVTNIGEAFATTGRAPAVLQHPSLVCRAAETTARGACTTHQNVQRSLNSSRTLESQTATVPTTM